MQDVVLEVVRFIPGPNDLVAFLEAVRPVDRSDVLRSLRALLLAIPPDRLWPEPMLDYAPDALIISSEEIGDVFTPWPTHLIVMSIFLAWDDADTASVCRAWRGCSQLRHVDVQFETLNQMQLDAFMDVAHASDASAEFESSDSLCAWLATTSATSLGLSDVAFHETKTALTSLALDHVDGLVPPSSLSSNL
ncbi:hypothetical protein SPRG_08844 [Saprolegnia parasitica CBS 223.65]|uniref:Uncharacterized protein n=1 Tax=Saprolegnia parasitica (strain CBS 223.65) TaxID=695850 RepID=A0A067C5V9_SAPPC|nr:hypothetical protein SPRG_08844 [Saprolegnia parasitica CBS 223.65]KDO25903.1 hypothetical protein SPRG_08844 [Saprolegnia parasitica CBS 223.65]|eukprot:XP_012203463.1 hypothetical protein SPRG_08844 [Saprolegnia parasitica CBS 223.65]